MILGVRRRLAPVWGRVSKLASKSPFDAKPVTLLGALFRAFRKFVTFDFSVIFEVTSDSKLYALWCPRGAQKEVFEEPFRSDFELSGESENEAPVLSGAPFSRF